AGVPAARAVAAGGMEEAVALARDLATALAASSPASDAARGTPSASDAAREAPAVILLSPAAPSYDHYRDFIARGERFRAAVEAAG
ncbi:hypothetical protein Q5424_20790, partial [Conexibacter sp. JD483]